MEGMSRLELFEQSVFDTRLVTRPSDGISKEFTDWDPAAHG